MPTRVFMRDSAACGKSSDARGTKSHRVWVHNILQRCTQLGEFNRLLQRHPDGINVAIIYPTDFESDIAVKTTVAVCEHSGAPKT